MGTYSGIEGYMKSDKKIKDIEVVKGKDAEKIYSVIKLDNIDMADLDMRILDDKG